MLPDDPADPPSLMAREATEAGDAVRRFGARSAAALAELGARLRAAPPPVVVTGARGSSDHACTFGKHLIETELGCPVASVGPSVASVYGRPLLLRGALFVAVSQSGRSPDLLELTRAARRGGALVLGMVNDLDSPLPELCDAVLPLAAGPERSVAATKSCLAAMAAFLQLVAHWRGDAELRRAADQLPDALDAARGMDWFPALRELRDARGLFVIGRGAALGVAAEMALKWKETCRVQAEAFSSAELMHGPLELVRDGFPVLALSQPDAALAGARPVLERVLSLGARLFTAGEELPGAVALPVLAGLPAVLAPLAALQSFYLAVARLARDRGLNPDAPANLRKVTRTV
ncbi:SIS domain-containing protein [Roseomonas sp. BN140053]|uniref:SIS domain-containing protein n=1 Tax=Roseomonas sp. BN140053 TaxID=3391898 RepID=UPI0039ED1530